MRVRRVQRAPSGVGGETAECEGRVHRAVVDAEVDGTDAARRWHADRLQERRALVELRVLAAGGRLL